MIVGLGILAIAGGWTANGKPPQSNAAALVFVLRHPLPDLVIAPSDGPAARQQYPDEDLAIGHSKCALSVFGSKLTSRKDAAPVAIELQRQDRLPVKPIAGELPLLALLPARPRVSVAGCGWRHAFREFLWRH